MIAAIVGLVLLAAPAFAGPAMNSLKQAAVTSQNAAYSPNPRKAQDLSSETLDGGTATPVVEAVSPHPRRSRGVDLSRGERRDFDPKARGQNFKEGFSALGIAGLWIGVGLFAQATPVVGVIWGAISLGMAFNRATSGEKGAKHWAGVGLLAGLGILGIAAPQIAAPVFIGVGVVAAAAGLYKLFSGLFKKKD